MSVFLEHTADTPALRILEYFIEFPQNDHAISDVITCVGISRSTFYAAWPNLLKMQYLIRSRTVGKTGLYKLNLQNEYAKAFVHIYKTAILEDIAKKRHKIKASTED